MDTKIKACFSGSFLITVSLIPFSNAPDNCIDEELSNMTEVRSFINEEQGCMTEATGANGKPRACQAKICYQAPSGWTIRGAVEVANNGRYGSEHEISAVFYEYNSLGQAEKACVNVYVRGPLQPSRERGFQHVRLKGDIEKAVTQQSLIQIAKMCNRKRI
jgi:hypothetical protein